jgi:hypothetical protein
VRHRITASQIDFSDGASTAVISDAARFVLPVPVLAGGGEPFTAPDGGALLDRKGRPIEGRGIVFLDPDDQSWEVAPGDGSGVILFGPMTPATTQALSRRIGEADALGLSELKAVIAYAVGDLAIRAAYASSKAYVAAAMVAEPDAAQQGYGLYRRLADQVCRAVYVPGSGSFLGPAASPQMFADGAVIIKHGDSIRLSQPASFEAAYRFMDGRPARVSELASQTP